MRESYRLGDRWLFGDEGEVRSSDSADVHHVRTVC